MNRRVGRFWIERRLIEDNPETVSGIFTRLGAIVVRAEMLYHRDQIEYICISPLFREVEPTEMTPDYEIIIHTNPYNWTVEAKEIKDAIRQ